LYSLKDGLQLQLVVSCELVALVKMMVPTEKRCKVFRQ